MKVHHYKDKDDPVLRAVLDEPRNLQKEGGTKTPAVDVSTSRAPGPKTPYDWAESLIYRFDSAKPLQREGDEDPSLRRLEDVLEPRQKPRDAECERDATESTHPGVGRFQHAPDPLDTSMIEGYFYHDAELGRTSHDSLLWYYMDTSEREGEW